jgi:hypothetical protein
MLNRQTASVFVYPLLIRRLLMDLKLTALLWPTQELRSKDSESPGG